jgi:hypothetical protein
VAEAQDVPAAERGKLDAPPRQHGRSAQRTLRPRFSVGSALRTVRAHRPPGPRRTRSCIRLGRVITAGKPLPRWTLSGGTLKLRARRRCGPPLP